MDIIPVRTELIVLPGDSICPHCRMRIYPDKIHTPEECIVAQVMEYEETIGFSITEKPGIAVVNSRGITKFKI